MYAVVKTGGKQYKVQEDDILRVEKLDCEVGNIITLDDVLMVSQKDELSFGKPNVDGASVAVEILAQRRARKVVIFKKRRRKSSQRKRGHRQNFTLVRVSEILTDGAKPSKKAKGMPEKKKFSPPVNEDEVKEENADAPKEKTKSAKKEESKSKENPKKDDDLSLLSGVGKALVKRLNDAGITSFKQIADLDEAGIKDLDEKANLGGRIEREEWQEQARELMAGKPPRAKIDKEKAAKTDKKD